MHVDSVSPKEYEATRPQSHIFYNSAVFNELNQFKVDSVDYLLIKKDDSVRFKICFGIKDKIAAAPFSAPFAMMVPTRKNPSILDYNDAAQAVNEYMLSIGIKRVRLILPPLFYDEDGITAIVNCFSRLKYNIIGFDINYALEIDKLMRDNYIQLLHSNERRNLNIALKSELELIECDSQDSKRIAYDIIAENRQAKGYPLRMTFKQIYDTMQTVDSKVFIVKNARSEYIASAFVYHINNSIAQVIYWGDKPGNSQYKSINFIAYRLLQYYHGLKFKYLDIGPSTENSIPNFGLCDFKESILCSRSLKFSLQKDYI